MQIQKWLGMRTIAVGVGALAIAAFTNNAAHAQLTLTVSDGGVAIDNTLNDTDPLPNEISYTDPFSPGLAANFHLAATNNPGTALDGHIRLDSTLVNFGALPVTLRITLTDSLFSAPAPGALVLHSSADASLSGADTATFLSTANATSTPLQTLGVGPGAFHDDKTVLFNYVGNYTLTSVTTASVAPGETTILGLSTEVVPEPGSLSLVAIGGLALLRRCRRA